MKILILSLFPIDDPKHGGQIRVRNLFEKYKSLGHEVVCAGVCGSTFYPQSKYFVPYPTEELSGALTAMEDYDCGRVYSQNNNKALELANILPWVPDVIHVEHPWLFQFAVNYRKQKNKDIFLIYGSANIESKLKRSILSHFHPINVVDDCVKRVEECEVYAIQHADACYAVSVENIAWMKQWGDTPIYLVPNGVEDKEITNLGNKKFLSLKLPDKFAVYCGSAHYPNCTGLINTFKYAFGSLSPDQKLVVIGGVCDLLKRDPHFHSIPNLAERTILLGYIDSDLVASLVANAHCVILPILEGEGTNLKTAEALWSGAYVVATKVAMRGFERFVNAPGVFVAETHQQFRRFLRDVMHKGRLNLTSEEKERRETVLWSKCLNNIENCLKQRMID